MSAHPNPERSAIDRLVALGVGPHAPIVVACSGGCDSMTLLRVLSRHRDPSGLVVAHVNHGLRGAESDADEVLVRTAAGAIGSRCEVLRIDAVSLARARKISVEEAGREARYEFFRALAGELGPDAIIATAHHADDLAETVLYRLAKGSTIHGLFPLLGADDGIVRPFADLSRRDIETYARDHGVAYRHDATNDDASIPRNLLRHEVLPRLARINPHAREAIRTFAEYAGEASEYLSRQADGWLGDDDSFEEAAFSRESVFFQREILRRLYERANGSTVGLSRDNI